VIVPRKIYRKKFQFPKNIQYIVDNLTTANVSSFGCHIILIYNKLLYTHIENSERIGKNIDL